MIKIIALSTILTIQLVVNKPFACDLSESKRGVVFYGHSFLSNQKFANHLGDSLCMKVYNFARGGSSSDETVLVSGASKTHYSPVGGEIPASGRVELQTIIGEVLNMWDGAYAFANYNGIPGEINIEKNGMISSLFFTRKYDGDVVKVTRPQRIIILPITRSKTKYVSKLSYHHKENDIAVIWLGRNSDIGKKEKIILDIKDVVTAIGSKNFVIMPEFPYSNESNGTEARRRLDSLNEALKNKFPDNYCQINGVDALQNFMEHYNPANKQDVADRRAGITPTSLRMDKLHPSDTRRPKALYVGTDVNADFVAKFIKMKGWG